MRRAWIALALLSAMGCRAPRSDRALNQQAVPAAPQVEVPAAPAAVTQLGVPMRLPPVVESFPLSSVVPAGALIESTKPATKTVQPAVGYTESSAAASSSSPTAGGSASCPTGPLADLGLNLSQAIDIGLTRNPEFVVQRGTIDVSRAVGNVTKVYPWNPFVQAQYFPNGRPFLPSSQPGGSAGLSNYYVWAMQRFELAHQRRFRAQIAAATVTQVQWNVHQAELLNVAQTTRLYFAALYQRELRDIVFEMAEVNERLLGVVERRFQTNLATVAELTTVRVAARQSRRQADLAEAQYNASLMALRQQLNVPLDQPLKFEQRLTDFAWAPVQDLESPDEATPPATCPQSLAASLIAARPDLMAAQAGVSVANANMLLSKAARMPDVAVGPIYETADDGTHYLGLRFQTDVPVFNNGTPLLNQRRAEMGQQRLVYAQLRERAMIDAQTAIDRYERDRRLVEKELAGGGGASSGGVPPELKQITDQFEAGQADILAVFNTQTNLLLERRAWVDLLGETSQAAANVVQSAALPPQRLVCTRAESAALRAAEPVPPPPPAPATGGKAATPAAPAPAAKSAPAATTAAAAPPAAASTPVAAPAPAAAPAVSPAPAAAPAPSVAPAQTPSLGPPSAALPSPATEAPAE